MPTTVLTNNSPGAPALTNTPGSLNTILKWALPQLGWTLEFEDAPSNVCVFRNQPSMVGSGGYMRVADTTNTHARVNLYATMSDVNTGTGQTGDANSSFVKVRDAGSPNLYEIWGNEEFFYLYHTADHPNTDAESSEIKFLQFVGNLIPENPTDNTFCMLLGNGSSSSSETTPDPWYERSYPFAAGMGTTSNNANSSKGGIARRFLFNHDGTQTDQLAAAVSGSVLAGGPYLYSGSVVIQERRLGVQGNRLDINGNSYISLGYITDRDFIRGRLPGILFPVGGWFGVYDSEETLSITNSLGTHDYDFLTLSGRISSWSFFTLRGIVLMSSNREAL